MNQELIDFLNKVKRYDLEVVGWEAQDLRENTGGIWIRISDILEAFNLEDGWDGICLKKP